MIYSYFKIFSSFLNVYIEFFNYLSIRFAGENCVNDNQCKNSQHSEESKTRFCKEGKCGGYDKGESCKSNDYCLSGLYCNKNNICKEQMSSGVCQNSYQCKNGLLCHQNQCKDVLYSFEIGHHFKDGDITDTEEVFLQKLCKYGLMDTNNTCISLSSQTQPEVNEDFVKCNISEQCVYNVYPLELSQTRAKKSECGYSYNGTSYCPMAHQTHSELWDKYFQLLKKVANNTCHTLHRYNCYKEYEKEKEMINMYRNMLEKGHLFYKSVPCAESILSGVYLNMRGFLLLGIIVSLFL